MSLAEAINELRAEAIAGVPIGNPTRDALSIVSEIAAEHGVEANTLWHRFVEVHPNYAHMANSAAATDPLARAKALVDAKRQTLIRQYNARPVREFDVMHGGKRHTVIGIPRPGTLLAVDHIDGMAWFIPRRSAAPIAMKGQANEV